MKAFVTVVIVGLSICLGVVSGKVLKLEEGIRWQSHLLDKTKNEVDTLQTAMVLAGRDHWYVYQEEGHYHAYGIMGEVYSESDGKGVEVNTGTDLMGNWVGKKPDSKPIIVGEPKKMTNIKVRFVPKKSPSPSPHRLSQILEVKPVE